MNQPGLQAALKKEFRKLIVISDKQFEQRFTTIKNPDSWQDDLFREYQTVKIRIELLNDLIGIE